MMNNDGYNGFVNRETWIVNLHFGDFLTEDIQDLYNDDAWQTDDHEEITDHVARYVEQFVLDQLEEVRNGPNVFVRDLVNDEEIDYGELAGLYVSELDTDD